MYTNETLELLKNKIDLSSVIEKKIKVINKGHDKIALCPFHNEKTPSFHINDSRGFYHCFGCGAHGDIITFTMNIEHLTFTEAIEKLAEDYNIEIKKEYGNAKSNEEIDEIKNIYKINELTSNFFCKNLFSENGKSCLNYFYNRGLNNYQIKLFKLGFATNSFNDLINFLKNQKITEELMLKSGVVAKNENGNIYDKFRNRAMIPVFDKYGRIIAFTGRVLDKNSMPKYMNSPETLIYHKGSVLFNYFFAKDAIYKNKKAILVEGNFDAISLYINGVENVVAPMGTAATIEQFNELWKNTEEIIVCFDGDEAGKKASRRVSEMILPIITPIKMVKFAFLPNEIDPDDFIKKVGKGGFEKFLNNKNTCYSLSEFLFRDRLKELNINSDNNNLIIPEDKSKLQDELNKTVRSIKNQLISKNFDYYFKGELFRMSSFVKNKQVRNYRETTKINNLNKCIIYENKNNIEFLKENILKNEVKIFKILFGNLDLISSLYTNYNIDIFNMEFLSDNSNYIMNIMLDAFNSEKKNDLIYIYNILEKNNLDIYTMKSSDENIFSIINDNDKKLKYIYILILEKNIAQLNIESIKLAIKNDNQEKRNVIDKELNKLNEEKKMAEEEF